MTHQVAKNRKQQRELSCKGYKRLPFKYDIKFINIIIIIHTCIPHVTGHVNIDANYLIRFIFMFLVVFY